MCVRRAGRCTAYVLPAGGGKLAVFTKHGLATEEAREAFVHACLVAASV